MTASVMTPECLRKLKEAFLRGYDNRGACIYAGIPESTFYSHCKLNPDFLEAKVRWQESIIMAARENLHSSIVREGDVNTSKWLLERRKKDEFSLRTESVVQEVDDIDLKDNDRMREIKELVKEKEEKIEAL
jgi:hypothetical protein